MNLTNVLIKGLYGKFNGKLFPVISYFGCFFVFAYLWLIKRKNQVILVPTSAIGDTLYIFSFLDVLSKWAEQEKKEVLFFSSDRYMDIVKSYSFPNDKVKVNYLKHLGFRHLFLQMFGGCKDHSLLNKLSRKYGIFAPIPNTYKDYFSQIHKPKGSRHQLALILGIPLTPISQHNLATIPIKNIADFERNKNRICILNPYSYSMYTPTSLFEKLSNELSKAGYIVYTNVVKGQKEIKGTIPLDCSLQELYSIAKEIPFVISLRSGILDYLIPSGVNMFVVYDKWKISFIEDDDYALNEWEPKGVLREVSTRTSSDEEIIQKLHQFLDRIGKGNEIWII